VEAPTTQTVLPSQSFMGGFSGDSRDMALIAW
jgi:hypothetical protein